MLKKLMISSLLMAVVGSQVVRADQILYDWSFNVNGDITENLAGMGDDLSAVSGLDFSLFDDYTGLGTLSLTFDPGTAGNYFVDAFFDLEFDEEDNIFSNEKAAINGTRPDDLTWEVDEPQYIPLVDEGEPPHYVGDIYNHFSDNEFDNLIFSSTQEFNTLYDINDPFSGEDVSVGLGWNFYLAAGEYAEITFSVTDAFSASGFYIRHYDPDSDESAVFTTNIDINGGSQNVPEPATGSLLVLGLLLVGFVGARRKR